eukprot:6647879-Alexandrium_andersonii.AAC.2
MWTSSSAYAKPARMSSKVTTCLGSRARGSTVRRRPTAGPDREMEMALCPVLRATCRTSLPTAFLALLTSAFLKYWAASKRTSES